MENQNQTEKERLEAEIRKNEEEIKRIQDEIDKTNELIKENKREQKSLIFKIVKGNVAIFFNYFWFYFSNTAKLPIYILAILYIGITLIWDRNMLALLLNIYNGRYSKDELDIIFGYFTTVTNHATFIFYIVLLSWYSFFS